LFENGLPALFVSWYSQYGRDQQGGGKIWQTSTLAGAAFFTVKTHILLRFFT
jgi:hypothetical protein